MNPLHRILAALVTTSVLAAAPLAQAGPHHHKDGMQGKGSHKAMCEEYHEGEGRSWSKEKQALMEEHKEKIADRLELTEEQRSEWDKIHEERRERHMEKRAEWREKMEKRCGDAGEGAE